MNNLIEGLNIIPEFINKDEEESLLKVLTNLEWNGTLLRKSMHFGYRYNYKTKNITNEDYLGILPDWSKKYIDRMINLKLISKYPNQITVNRYLPGEGISAHIDVPSIFDNELYSISLGSGCNIVFKNKIETHSYYIKPRTFMMMKDDSRYNYTHEICRHNCDIVNNESIKRDTRYSITFRNVIIQNHV